MPPLIPRGIERGASGPGRLAATTFVELVVTIFLLVAFASLVFPLFWGSGRANASAAVENAAQRAELTLASVLPPLCEEVHPPYWARQESVFQASGTEWKALYYNGKEDEFLVVKKDGDSRLTLVTGDRTLSIGNLPGLSVDWWEKDKRIIGITVQWHRGSRTRQFHAAWGSLAL